jgi:hypothetical protein
VQFFPNLQGKVKINRLAFIILARKPIEGVAGPFLISRNLRKDLVEAFAKPAYSPAESPPMMPIAGMPLS